MKKLQKIVCEICGEKDKDTLDYHHIYEQAKDADKCTNHPFNLAIICSNCHKKIHAGTIEVLGLIPSTQIPYGRSLLYSVGGIKNIPDIEPIKPPALPSIKIPEK